MCLGEVVHCVEARRAADSGGTFLRRYGSEFPWDSTGHEEIHTWLMHQGGAAEHVAANRTVQAVLAYSSLVPHWA